MNKNLKARQKSIPHPSKRGQMVNASEISMYQGNIPDPESLEHYERIKPGFADRLIAMTEQEGNHRRSMEIAFLKASKNSFGWTIFGALLSVTMICSLCGYAFHLGHAREGAWVAGTVMVALASAFLASKLLSKSAPIAIKR